MDLDLDFAPIWVVSSGTAGIYDIAILEITDWVTVVVRDRDDNPGHTVSNAIGSIASAVWRRAGLLDTKMRVFEQHRDGRQIFDEVVFSDGFDEPIRRRLENAEEMLTGLRITGEGW